MADFFEIARLTSFFLSAIVILGAWFDLRERRIPNALVFPAALLGLSLNASRGWGGFWFSSQGLMIGFGLLFIPYLFHVMGAGDVKFLSAIGSFVGGTNVMRVLLLGLLIYPILAVGFLIQQRKFALTMKRFAKLVSKLLGVFIPALGLYAAQLDANEDSEIASATSPFGLALSIGTLLALYTNFLR